MPDLVSDEQLAEIEQQPRCGERVDDHGAAHRCGQEAALVLWGKLFPPDALGPRCEYHASAYMPMDAHSVSQWAVYDLRPARRVVRALRDARAERDALLQTPPTTLALVQREFVESELYRGRSQALRERDEARDADHGHKLLADAWWRKYRDAATERDSLQAENQQLGTTLERAATGLESVLAGRPVRDADEILAAARSALAAPTGDRQDWTADANGRSNSSDTFVAIVAIVARLLRSEMWSITQDDAGRESAARLIVAQLAHKHGFAPVAAPTGQEQNDD